MRRVQPGHDQLTLASPRVAIRRKDTGDPDVRRHLLQPWSLQEHTGPLAQDIGDQVRITGGDEPPLGDSQPEGAAEFPGPALELQVEVLRADLACIAEQPPPPWGPGSSS